MKILILLGIFLAGPALAAPRLTFEGVLTDTDGALLDGPVALTFALYDAAEGGAALWSETHPEVEVLEGDFYATLGDIEPLGTVLATDAPLWIGLAVDGEGELSPRNAITEVPRAAAALWAADVTGQHIHPREISVGDTQVIDAQGNWVGPAGPGGGGADYQYRFTTLDGYGYGFCGLLVDGRALCFGPFIDQPPDVRFSEVTASWATGCGIRENREVLCWGSPIEGRTAAPFGQYLQIRSGNGHSCGILQDGRLTCWGPNSAGERNPPPGRFVALCAGTDVSCAVEEGTGAIRCWGRPLVVPEGGGYTQVECTFETVCGLHEDGSLRCAGPDTPPEGRFRKIAAGERHFCGIKDDSNTVCWSNSNDTGAIRYTGGPGLADLALGRDVSCGIRQDGTVFCWGNPRDQLIQPPVKAAP